MFCINHTKKYLVNKSCAKGVHAIMRFQRIDKRIAFTIRRGIVYVKCDRFNEQVVIYSFEKDISRRLIKLISENRQDLATDYICEYAYLMMNAHLIIRCDLIGNLIVGKKVNPFRSVVIGGLNAIYRKCMETLKTGESIMQNSIDDSIKGLLDQWQPPDS